MDVTLDHLQNLFFDANENDASNSTQVSSMAFVQPTKIIPEAPDYQDLDLTQVFKPSGDRDHQTHQSSQLTTSSQDCVGYGGNITPGYPVRPTGKSNRNISSIVPLIGTVTPSTLIKPQRISRPLFRTPFNHSSYGETVIDSQHLTEKQNSVADITEDPKFFQEDSSQVPHLEPGPGVIQLGGTPESVFDTENNRDPFNFIPASFTFHGLTPGGSKRGILKLKSTEEVPDPYRQLFKFPYFNVVQSKVFDDVFYSDKPLILCAPTGSGKTLIFELAIIRLILTQHGNTSTNSKVVYMAPIKALCSERYEDWKMKFGGLGLRCLELTGDSETDSLFELEDVHIVLTTPEKWDSMTRRWRNNKSMVQKVRLFLIDEVHTLNDEFRGATMEAVISRMKTVHTELTRRSNKNGGGMMKAIRFVAVSATLPNVEDVGEWLRLDDEEAATYNIDESYRPVRLRKVVLGYPCPDNLSEFKFDLSLNYKLATVIQTYSDQRPALVFCATRKGTLQAASILVKDARFVMNAEHKQRLFKRANGLKDSKLRELVLSGVAFHHAGLDVEDRKAVESLFAAGDIPVLFATSTLAMGVNLPAHLVIIKSTEHYVMGSYLEYTDTQILQMIGRAGRPQFDITATAVIMTKMSTKSKYENLLSGNQMIESSLHLNLVEHLNAEIVLNTITDVSVALEWAKSTFLYIRMLKNPKEYGLAPNLSKEQTEQHLQDLCLKSLNALACYNLIKMDENMFVLDSTETGRLMARYCIAFETMKNFNKIRGTESLEELLLLLCNSQEFSDIQLRVMDKKTLNMLNKDKHRQTIRFPIKGKVKTKEMKVNCLIQAQLGCLTIQDFGLQQDLNKINRASFRVVRCLVEVLWQQYNHFRVLLNAIILSKCMRAHLWENSKFVTKQLSGIGITLSNALVNAGITSFQKAEEKSPRDIELIVNRHPPFGKQFKDAVAHLPKYNLYIDQLCPYRLDTAELSIRINLANSEILQDKATASRSHTCILILGDMDNNIVYKVKICDAVLLREGSWYKKLDIRRAKQGDQLSINLISQDWVGLDVQSVYKPMYSMAAMTKSTATNNQMAIEKDHSKQREVKPILTNPDTIIPNQNIQPEANFDLVTADDILPDMDKPRSSSRYHCKNDDTCFYECCKHGVVPNERRIPIMERFRLELKHKMDSLPTTPSIKCKKKYAYNPRNYQAQSVNSVTSVDTSMVNQYLLEDKSLRQAPEQNKISVLIPPNDWEELDLFEQRCQATTEWNYDVIHNEPETNDCFPSEVVHLDDSYMKDRNESRCGNILRENVQNLQSHQNHKRLSFQRCHQKGSLSTENTPNDCSHKWQSSKPVRAFLAVKFDRNENYQRSPVVRPQLLTNHSQKVVGQARNYVPNMRYPLSSFGYVSEHVSQAKSIKTEIPEDAPQDQCAISQDKVDSSGIMTSSLSSKDKYESYLVDKYNPDEFTDAERQSTDNDTEVCLTTVRGTIKNCTEDELFEPTNKTEMKELDDINTHSDEMLSNLSDKYLTHYNGSDACVSQSSTVSVGEIHPAVLSENLATSSVCAAVSDGTAICNQVAPKLHHSFTRFVSSAFADKEKCNNPLAFFSSKDSLVNLEDDPDDYDSIFNGVL